jgi:hypothetical protein
VSGGSGGPAATQSPEELARRLDALLEAAQSLLRDLPSEAVTREPGLRDLAYQVFRGALACIEAIDRGRLDPAWLDEAAPPALDDGPALARFGALGRARLAGWFQGAGRDDYERSVATPEGPRSGHALLAQAVVQAGADVRRLHVVAGSASPPPTPPSAGARGGGGP